MACLLLLTRCTCLPLLVLLLLLTCVLGVLPCLLHSAPYFSKACWCARQEQQPEDALALYLHRECHQGNGCAGVVRRGRAGAINANSVELSSNSCLFLRPWG